jgi:hypothetical protein
MAKSFIAIVTGVSVVVFWGTALAQIGSSTTGPTQTDFEICNREAQMKVGASASPGGDASTSAPARAGGTTIGTRGVGESATVGGGAGGTGAMTQTPSGTTTGIGRPGSGATGVARRGTSTAGVAGAAGAGAAAGGAASGGSTLGGDSTLSGGSALSRVEETADAQLRGLGAIGENDPQYRAAYRECMKTRGF